MAELECEKRSECELVKKTKKLVARIRQLFELQRELSKTRREASGSGTLYT